MPLALSKPSNAVLIAVLLAWLPVAVGLGFLAWRRMRQGLGSAVAAVAGVALAAVAVMLPYQVARTVYLAVHVDRPLRSFVERAPAYSFGTLDVPFFDRLRQAMPPGSTYFVAAPPPDLAIRAWSFYWLLPHIAVSRPAGADWIIARDVDRRSLGVRVRWVTHGSFGVFAGRETR